MAEDGITDGKRQDEPEEAGATGGPGGLELQKGPRSSGRPPTVRDLQVEDGGRGGDDEGREQRLGSVGSPHDTCSASESEVAAML